jgi:hypothetical protein
LCWCHLRDPVCVLLWIFSFSWPVFNSSMFVLFR